jgi:ATP-binding cassette, subfamily B, bacterial CvaB/MchF/RaxB
MDILKDLNFGFGRRLPMVLQTERAECSLACLAMVAAFYGYDIDLRTLRQRFSISQKGATLAQLILFAGRMELATRAVRIELDEITHLTLPAILHWDMNHFVVLKAIQGHRLIIHDPAHGIRSLPISQASDHFTGVALEIIPNATFIAKTERVHVKLSDLTGRLVGVRGSAILLLGLAFALEALTLVSPFYMQMVVDNVVVSSNKTLLVTLAIGFGLVVVLQTCLTAFRSWVVLYLGTTFKLQWFSRVFSHLVRLPTKYFERRHIGDIVARFASIGIIQQTLATGFVEAILDGIMALITGLMMFVYSTKLGLISLASVLCYMGLRWFAFAPLREANDEQISLGARQQSTFLETIRGIQSIKIFGSESQRVRLWLNQVVDTTNREIKTQKFMVFYRFSNSMILGLQNIVVIYVGSLLVINGGMSLGMLFAFLSYQTNFAGRIVGLIDKFVEYRMLGLYGERLADIVLHEKEHLENVQSWVDAVPLESFSLTAENINFRYSESEPYIVKGVSFTVDSGDCVAIVGPSGCGKTTLLKILLGLLQPSEGRVLVSGVDVQQFGLGRFRNLVGAVMQEDYLFMGSISDNICCFDTTPDLDWLQQCARTSSIHEDIVKMPMGYDTLMGDMGSGLSGGQRQRILLARALYKRPSILLMDEATSHLDVFAESKVSEALSKLNITRILVAHRPETIASARRVLMLSQNGITEDTSAMVSRDGCLPVGIIINQ